MIQDQIDIIMKQIEKDIERQRESGSEPSEDNKSPEHESILRNL